MLKKILFVSIVLIVISGCSKKESKPDQKVDEDKTTQGPTKKSLEEAKQNSSTNPRTVEQSTDGPLIIITSFDQLKKIAMEDTTKLTVMDMYADWCGPCKLLAPIYLDLAKEYGDKVNFLKINVDKNRDIAQDFKAQNIPYVVFLKGNKIVTDLVGLHTADNYKKTIEDNL